MKQIFDKKVSCKIHFYNCGQMAITGIFLTFLSALHISSCVFDLTVLHTNDVHARVQEINTYGGQCTMGECYGGAARMKTKIDEIRGQYPNSLLLDAGDQYQGTLWFNHYGGDIIYTMMNRLKYDIMALGNHEFDNGITGLLPFLKNANFTILSCNIDTSTEPSIEPYIAKHHVAFVGGEQVGVIGYTTKDTPIISLPGSLRFLDEVQSIRNEVTALQNKGVNKIIALGHSGFSVDKRIAEEVDGVDIVVGGHTNTFLYTGTAPSNEKPVGEYPHVVTKSSGIKTLVVQDYAFGKYLGFLQVQFDDNGVIQKYGGNPVLLNSSVPKDPEVLSVVNVLKVGVENATKSVIGRSLVRLEGDRSVCRLKECNMGNLIADAFVHQNLKAADTINGTRVFISLVNSGSIRSSFVRGRITLGNAVEVQPLGNTIETIQLQGKYLRAALENSVTGYDKSDPDGGFLQVSGIKVIYDMRQPEGSRVVDVQVVCSDCEVPEYKPLDNNKLYGIMLSNFILNGGNGYSVIEEHALQDVIVGSLDSDMFAEYIKVASPLKTGLEGRIRFVSEHTPYCQTSSVCVIHVYSLFSVIVYICFTLLMSYENHCP